MGRRRSGGPNSSSQGCRPGGGSPWCVQCSRFITHFKHTLNCTNRAIHCVITATIIHPRSSIFRKWAMASSSLASVRLRARSAGPGVTGATGSSLVMATAIFGMGSSMCGVTAPECAAACLDAARGDRRVVMTIAAGCTLAAAIPCVITPKLRMGCTIRIWSDNWVTTVRAHEGLGAGTDGINFIHDADA